MKIYFLSSQPCALRLGGVFFGVTDRFERFAEVDLRDNIFVEFLPENAAPVTFFLTENIRFSAPAHCEVYLLADGIAVYAAEFTPVDFTLRTLWQARLGTRLFTVFSQGRLQLSVQTDAHAFTAYLPPLLCNFEGNAYGEYILLCGDAQAEKRLLVFRENGEKVLDERVLSYALQDGVLRAELPLSERLGRSAKCAWSLQDGAFTRTEFTLLERARADGGAQAQDGLIAYAFFESVLIGANFDDFLSPDLLPDAGKIVEFLGNYGLVTQTDDPNVCGLVRNVGERLFSLAYFRVKIQDGKIVDISG